MSGTGLELANRKASNLVGCVTIFYEGLLDVVHAAAFEALAKQGKRPADLPLFSTQGDGRLNAHSSASWDEDCDESHQRQKQRDDDVCQWVINADLKQQGL